MRVHPRPAAHALLLVAATAVCWWYGAELRNRARAPLHNIQDYKSSSSSSSAPSSSWLSFGRTQAPARSVSAQRGGNVSTGTVGADAKAGPHPLPRLNDASNIVTMLHITDLHLSVHEPYRMEHFRSFLTHTLPNIAPALILASGDLTDAKDQHKQGSLQYRDEWVQYYKAVKEAGVLDRWFDQRGNHDAFNVPSADSVENYFAQFSATRNNTGFFHHLSTNFGSIAIVGIDHCPMPGPGRPYNFFGVADRTDMDYLQSQLQRARSLPRHLHTFVMSHYPISTTVFGTTSDGRTFRGVVYRDASLWLCGHLHQLVVGLGKRMHAFHPKFHLLELELGDMKDHAMYRIMAIDHDIIAFRDLTIPLSHIPAKTATPDSPLKYTHHPTVLVTWPKDARYIIPGRENITTVKSSLYIRVLVYPAGNGKAVTETNLASLKGRLRVYIDNVPLDTSRAIYAGTGSPGDYGEYKPLWLIPWSTAQYDNGASHVLVVQVVNDDHSAPAHPSATHEVKFRLDSRRMQIDAEGAGVLQMDFDRLVSSIFIFNYIIIAVGGLLVPRLFVLFHEHRGTMDAWLSSTSARLVHIDAQWLQKKDLELTFPFGILRRAMVNSAWFFAASFLRFVCLARQARLWPPLYALALAILVMPYIATRGLMVRASLLDLLAPSAWLTKNWAYVYVWGIYFAETGEWLPLLDSVVMGCFEISFLLGPLVLYSSYAATPTTMLYAPSNPRRTRPLHRTRVVRVMVFACVLHQSTNVLMNAVFYGPDAAVFSLKTAAVLYAARTMYKVIILRRDEVARARAHASDAPDTGVKTILRPHIPVSPSSTDRQVPRTGVTRYFLRPR